MIWLHFTYFNWFSIRVLPERCAMCLDSECVIRSVGNREKKSWKKNEWKMQFSIIWFSIHLFLRDVTKKNIFFYLYCIRVFSFSYICRIIIISYKLRGMSNAEFHPLRNEKRNLRANTNWMKIYPTQDTE